jgi:hypothetical protein
VIPVPAANSKTNFPENSSGWVKMKSDKRRAPRQTWENESNFDFRQQIAILLLID